MCKMLGHGVVFLKGYIITKSIDEKKLIDTMPAGLRPYYEDGSLVDFLTEVNLKTFIHRSFLYLHPGSEFIDNWHISLLSEYLEAVRLGQIKRLIINMPPRSLKSLSVSVAFPAWLLGKNPATKIITASYSAALSEKHSMDSQKILESDWYKKIFYKFAFGSKKTSKQFTTNMYGHRVSTSSKSCIVGQGADYIIIDDPHNPSTINHQTQRNSVINWFKTSIATRLNNSSKGAIILVMQRLHEDDLCANLPSSWERLILPIKAPKDIIYKIRDRSYNYKKDAFLNEPLINDQSARNLMNEVGRNVFMTQYMQDPSMQDECLVKRSDFKYYKIAPEKFDFIVHSWDTAIKATGRSAAFSAGTCWGVKGENYYLLDIIKKKVPYPALKDMVFGWKKKWSPRMILIEDKASGQQLIQDFRWSGVQGIEPVLPKGSKISRFERVIPIIESGRALLPFSASWLEGYLFELCGFPLRQEDDLVDSTSQFLGYMQTRGNKKSWKFFIRDL